MIESLDKAAGAYPQNTATGGAYPHPMRILYKDALGVAAWHTMVPLPKPLAYEEAEQGGFRWVMYVWDVEEQLECSLALDHIIATRNSGSGLVNAGEVEAGDAAVAWKKLRDMLHHEADEAIWDLGLRGEGLKRVWLDGPNTLYATVTRVPGSSSCKSDSWCIEESANSLLQEWVAAGRTAWVDLYCPLLGELLRLRYSDDLQLVKAYNPARGVFWRLYPKKVSASRLCRLAALMQGSLNHGG